MQQFSRKGFIQTLTLGGGSLLTTGLAQQAFAADSTKGSGKGSGLKNSAFSLSLKHDENGISAHVVHLPTNTILADGPYSYSFGPLALSIADHDANSVTIKGTTDSGLELTHIMRLGDGPWLEEEILLKNTTQQPVSATFRCGFVLPVKPGTLKDYTFTAVPFRREPRDGSHSYQDFKLDDVLYQLRRSNLREDGNPLRLYQDYYSEGWAATDGKNGFLFSKYNQTAREFSVLDRIPARDNLTGLRWGGAGTDPQSCEGFTEIPAGATHSFGTSRLTAFDGDLTQGYYAFRKEMDSRGMGVPTGFNPPVHWNELYDNKLWWTQDPGGQDNPDNRKKYYTRDLILQEAAKAKAIGCEALYCDPGWDTNFASKIWDESRMGKVTDFVATLKNGYGLKLSLHTPLSGWCNPSSYAPECFRARKDGSRTGSLCGASHQYVDETARRLNILAEAGVTYFMFDGTAYNPGDPCWDPSHGHPLPLTMAAHVDATNLIACKVHEKYPKVSIEMHDQVMGGAPFRYVPLYYGYGKNVFGTSTALGFDTIWAFEMMWDPQGNLHSGQSILLYYYNLAYSLPLYLHIDLRSDNEAALVFWWNASTCRYLGIGGTSTDPKINDAHAAAMKDYVRLKPHFVAGTFYGINEMTHVHKHPTDNTAVINCFSIDNAPPSVQLDFDPAKFGLKPGASYKFTNADATKSGDIYLLKVSIAQNAHTLVEVTEG